MAEHHRLHPVSLSRAVAGLLEPDQLARYADAVVKVGTSVGRGDDLIVSCQPAHREFAVALVEAGYRAGARSVEVEYNDPLVRAAYLRTAPDQAIGYVTPWRGARVRASLRPETATLWVAGEGDPGALKDVPGKRLAADVTRSSKRFGDVLRASRQGKRRWSIAGWPTESWAAAVYPKLGSVAAQRRLARDLLDFCRVGPDDAPGVTGLRATPARSQAASAAPLAAEAGARRAARPRHRALGRAPPGRRLVRRRSDQLLRQAHRAEPADGGVLHVSDRRGDRRDVPLLPAAHVPGHAGRRHLRRVSRRPARPPRREEGDRDFLADFLFEIKDADRLGEVALVDSSSRSARRAASTTTRCSTRTQPRTSPSARVSRTRARTTTRVARAPRRQPLGRARRRDDRHAGLRGDRLRRARPARPADRRRRLADLTST